MPPIDLQRAIGLNGRGGPAADGDGHRNPHREGLTRLVNLQLAATGLPTASDHAVGSAENGNGSVDRVTEGLLANFRE